jgi:hypothetical protein
MVALPVLVESRSRVDWILHLRGAGMFSNVNQFLESVRRCDDQDRLFVDWRRSRYADVPDVHTFSDFFDWPRADVGKLETGEYRPLPAHTHGADLVVAPRGRDINFLMPPRDRAGVKRLIDRHLRLGDRVATRLEEATQRLLAGRRTIGLHVRGPGRRAGGISRHIVAMQWKWPGVRVPPYRAYFAKLDELWRSEMFDQILICTDSSAVRERFARRYGQRLVWLDASLTSEGEMHARPSTHRFSKQKLGDDAIVEAYLLAGTQFLVHGNSNLTNFVLCDAPELPSHDVYQRYYDGRAWESVLVDKLAGVMQAHHRNISKLEDRVKRALNRWVRE